MKTETQKKEEKMRKEMTESEARCIVSDITENTPSDQLSDEQKQALKIVIARLNQLMAVVREEALKKCGSDTK